MKLLTFEEQGVHKLGVKTEQGIIDVTASAKSGINVDVQTDIMSIIAGGEEEVSKLRDFIDHAISEQQAVFIKRMKFTWGPSVTKPTKYFV